MAFKNPPVTHFRPPVSLGREEAQARIRQLAETGWCEGDIGRVTGLGAAEVRRAISDLPCDSAEVERLLAGLATFDDKAAELARLGLTASEIVELMPSAARAGFWRCR